MSDTTNPSEPSIDWQADGIGSLTNEQAIEMANALKRYGVDHERVNAALKRDGFREIRDERSADAKTFDEVLGPPSNLNDYRINYRGRPNGITEGETLTAFDTAARAWLHEIGFSADVGSSVIDIALDAGQRVSRMSPAERKVWSDNQHGHLEKFAASRGTSAAEMRKVADTVLEFGSKELSDQLRVSGAMNDAGLVMQLAMQGQRIAYRQSLKG